MPYPPDYDPRRNPQNHRLNDEQLRQVEGTHDVLDVMEAIKPHLDQLTEKYGLPDGEAYYLFSDAFSDLGHAIRGGLDITEQPYREERPAIRAWDEAVAVRAAQRRDELAKLWTNRVQPGGRGIER